MEFGVNGQVKAKHSTDFFEKRPRRGDEDGRMDEFPCLQADAVYTAIRNIHAGYPLGLKPDPESARRFEEVHAQLLRAQPTSAACMQRSRSFLIQIRKVLLDQFGAEQQVRACGLVCESLWLRGPVGRLIGSVNSQWSGAQV